MREPKVSVPLSYLENLIRDCAELNCAFVEVTGALAEASAKLEVVEKELEAFKKPYIPTPQDPFAPPKMSDASEREIRRLFVLGRDYPSSRFDAYESIRELLNREFPGQKIHAIKKICEVTGSGLKEAKEFYEGSNVLLYSPRL